MIVSPSVNTYRALIFLISFHIIIIAASNYLVQIPVNILGIITTWGTFSFPFVYLATDLTVRIFGTHQARRIIFGAMIPALLVSYVISILFFQGKFQGFSGLATFNLFVFRIALASFIAYVVGQLFDIKIFARLRENENWWIAPSASTIAGNFVDTLLFYSIAFYASPDDFMASHWPEIATVDYGFKLFISILLFLPIYGVILKMLSECLSYGSSNTGR